MGDADDRFDGGRGPGAPRHLDREQQANATIQIDLTHMDKIEIVDNPPEAEPPSRVRKTPPPLPAPAPPARSTGKTLALVAVFFVLLAGAIAGGLAVGTRAPASVTATAPAVTTNATNAAPATSTPPQPSEAPVLTLPAVEVR